jgi:hypothetical protein
MRGRWPSGRRSGRGTTSSGFSVFPNPYRLTDLTWHKDSRALTFEYNQRGHQVYRVIARFVDVPLGPVTAEVHERGLTQAPNGDVEVLNDRFPLAVGRSARRIDAALIRAAHRQRWMRRASVSGSSGRHSETRAGVSRRIDDISCGDDSPVNGRDPVTISWNSTPNRMLSASSVE